MQYKKGYIKCTYFTPIATSQFNRIKKLLLSDFRPPTIASLTKERKKNTLPPNKNIYHHPLLSLRIKRMSSHSWKWASFSTVLLTGVSKVNNTWQKSTRKMGAIYSVGWWWAYEERMRNGRRLVVWTDAIKRAQPRARSCDMCNRSSTIEGREHRRSKGGSLHPPTVPHTSRKQRSFSNVNRFRLARLIVVVD